MLTSAELARYSRQVVLPEIGLAGQERLARARVLVIGAGGLGSPAALYLAAAGVGVLGIADDDSVDLSNLHRQILHGSAAVGHPKTTSAAESIHRLNPQVDVRMHRERITGANAASMFSAYDLAIDGSDNYATRYAVNDACAQLGMTWVYGSVERFSGQVSVFGAPEGPCYRCIFPEAPAPGSSANCEEIGVLGAVPGVVGSMQAVEAMKLILGIGQPLIGRLLQLDLRAATIHEIRIARREGCPACSSRARGQRASAALPVDDHDVADIDPAELAKCLGSGAPPILLDVRESWELAVGRIGEPRHVPMNALPAAVASFDRSAEMVVYCHLGTRSSMATEWLRAQGFRVRNLAGGIDRWSREVDPSIPRY